MTINLKQFFSKMDYKKIISPLFLAIRLFLLFIFFLLIYSIVFWNKIFPGVEIAGLDVGRLKPDEATNKLSQNIKAPEKIILVSQNQKFEIPLSSINFSYDHPKSVEAAYFIYRTGNFSYDIYHQVLAFFNKKNLGLRFNLDESSLEQHLSVISGQVGVEPVFPSLKFSAGNIIVEKGSAGTDVDTEELKLLIGQNLAFANFTQVTIPTKVIDPSLTDNQISSLKSRAERFLGKNIIAKFESSSFEYAEAETFQLIDPEGGYDQAGLDRITKEVSTAINSEPQNAVFEYKTGKVQEFLPAKNGIKVSSGALSNEFISALTNLENSDETSFQIEIPVEEIAPLITTEQVNSLGIKELLGTGKSRFSGSIASRIYNIRLASSKFNGVLVAPGETFSFNDSLGDVSVFTGYKQAYIIKDGKTVLGDGGGVCQVSTTFFRAILNAGLPIVERRAHSYRVYYYEQDSPPGLDATVYAPTTDLKFKNDTPGYLLIQTLFNQNSLTLVFEIYGTSDGRSASTTKPIVTDVVPPPEDLYQDDPTLPAGTIKQIDWKAWGAKVRFTYSVERDEEIIYQKTFYSNFRPWQAVFLRGTGPTN